VFPTVSDGNINITSKESIEKTELNVYDLSGKIVYSDILNLSFKNTSIDLSGLQPGLYILKFSMDNMKYTHKIVIR
jgi:hypothetical protein